MWERFNKFFVDSRKVEPGGVFFALRGARVDGHTFLPQCVDKGVVAAVVQEDYAGPDLGIELVRVLDPFATLQLWAQQKFAAMPAFKIGITGSLGKTTTKEFLAHLLSCRYRVAKTIESYNGQIGLPLTILNSAVDVDVLVLEMGINRSGEMQRLIEIAPIDLALITGISRSHIGNFTSFAQLEQQKKIILNSPRLKASFFKPAALSHLKPFQVTHLNDNFAMAAAVALHVGVTQEQIEQQMAGLTLAPHRFNRIEKNGVIYIDDSFNASALSICAALDNMPKGERQIAVLSEMVEMGEYHDEEHRKVGEWANHRVAHLFVLGHRVGPMLEAFSGDARHFTDFEALKKAVGLFVMPGDVVLIKGANSKRLWRLIED